MNLALLVEFSKNEIKDVVFQMNGLGIPGPNGFLAYLYQKNLPSVGKDVCKFVLDMLNFRTSLEWINQTYITHIPKVKNTQRVGDFRPISLCNVIYKIVAKTLANRLKRIFPKIISPQ